MVQIAKDEKEFYIDQINKIEKKISKNKLTNINKNVIDEDYEDIMKELEWYDKFIINYGINNKKETLNKDIIVTHS